MLVIAVVGSGHVNEGGAELLNRVMVKKVLVHYSA